MEPTNNHQSPPVKYRFKNIGPVKEAELELGDLTIIAGRNNTGKTYLVYTLYGFLKMWKEWPSLIPFLAKKQLDTINIIDQLARKALEEGQAKRPLDWETFNRHRRMVIKGLTQAFSTTALANVFSSSRENFSTASIEIELSDLSPTETGPFEATSRSRGTFSIQYRDGDLVITQSSPGERQDSFTPEIRRVLSGLYLQLLFPELPFDPFLLSAERFGISLFYKELDFTKNQLVNLLQQWGDDKNKKSPFPFFLVDKAASRYALPIKDNIDYTRSIPELKKRESEIHENKLFNDIKDLMNGYYKASGDDIEFHSTARKERRFSIPLHLASSSARGLSDLYFFLRHVAQKNHLLIIDEPESHLDTTNQILLARLLARLVRAGVKVLVTTHSDYLVKEINNLIMLNRPFADKSSVVKELGYKADDFLPQDSIRAYVTEKNSLSRCKVDEFGIEMPVFDTTIDSINLASNELASRLNQAES